MPAQRCSSRRLLICRPSNDHGEQDRIRHATPRHAVDSKVARGSRLVDSGGIKWSRTDWGGNGRWGFLVFGVFRADIDRKGKLFRRAAADYAVHCALLESDKITVILVPLLPFTINAPKAVERWPVRGQCIVTTFKRLGSVSQHSLNNHECLEFGLRFELADNAREYMICQSTRSQALSGLTP